MVKVSVLFVCLGNICRSPTAHGVFQKIVDDAGLSARIVVDSAGTSDWHIGKAPDARSAAEALKAGYDLSPLRGRQVQKEDFETFDYILAMDEANLAALEALRPATYGGHLGLFLAFSSNKNYREVPDPYHGGREGFTLVLNMVEEASQQLLRQITTTHL